MSADSGLKCQLSICHLNTNCLMTHGSTSAKPIKVTRSPKENRKPRDTQNTGSGGMEGRWYVLVRQRPVLAPFFWREAVHEVRYTTGFEGFEGI